MFKPSALAQMRVEEAIAGVSSAEYEKYVTYWASITPKTDYERWTRWVYALCSPQCSWERNSIQCDAVLSNSWTTQAELAEVLRQTRSGLYNERAKSLWLFTQTARNPVAGSHILSSGPSIGYGHVEWRNRLADAVYGAQHKVISFAHEMCFPLHCRVLTIDTHIRQLYGVPPKKALKQNEYELIEKHWISACDRRRLWHPSMVRHVVWDKIHGETSTRYWSYVFEKDREESVVEA